MATTSHEPVLVSEVIELLVEGRGELRLMFDGTLGGGGHSEALLKAVPEGFLVAFDLDERAISRAKKRLEHFSNRMAVFKENFRNIFEQQSSIARELRLDSDIVKFDTMLVDLGISSDQLDDAERGLSFKFEGPLDMRLSPLQRRSGADLLNNLSPVELSKIFAVVGIRSRKFIDRIISSRPIETTTQLRVICEDIFGTPRERRLRSERGGKNSHPALLPFLALRIAVNDEFGALNEFLEAVPQMLSPGGRVGVISFHSLEDQHVTRAMRKWSAPGPRGLPVSQSKGRVLTPSAVKPSEGEIERNPRSRSALLRVFELGW